MISHVANQQARQVPQKPSRQSTDGAKEDSNPHPYKIKKLEVKDPEYMSEVPEYLQNKEIPGFPSTVVSIGEPGSGKTSVLINLLTNPQLWKGFFDICYFFGPTCDTDKLYKLIRIDEDQIVTKQEEFLPKLTEWLDNQKDDVKHNPEQAKKALFVFEDITSFYHSLQASPEFGKCFSAIRHHKATAYAHVHKVKAFNRTARMSCQHIICFPVNKSEIDVLYNDWGPRCLDKHQWAALVEEAWRKDEFSDKPFLYINKYQPEEKRYRKCFTHIIDLKVFQSMDLSSKKRKKSDSKPSQDETKEPNYQPTKSTLAKKPKTAPSSSTVNFNTIYKAHYQAMAAAKANRK